MTDETSTTPPGGTDPVVTPPLETRPYVMQARDAEVSSGTGSLKAALGVLAVIVLVGGVYVWSLSSGASEQTAALQDQIKQMQTRIQQLEARPLPQPPPPPPNLAPIEQRLTALENKPPPKVALDDEARKQIAAVAGRLDSVEARENQLGTQEQTDATKFAGQIGDLDKRLSSLAQTANQLTALQAKEQQTAQLQAAAAALAAGKPLGAIPGAPPALAKFATQAPPTDAQLRTSFETAANAAQEAGEPPPPNTPLLERMWDRAQSAVTVRQGGHVLVGNTVAGVIETARHDLTLGDLQGAVNVLGELTGPAAQAMAAWRTQAQSLIDARAALAQAHS